MDKADAEKIRRLGERLARRSYIEGMLETEGNDLKSDRAAERTEETRQVFRKTVEELTSEAPPVSHQGDAAEKLSDKSTPERYEIIEAAVAAITPNMPNETAAWNTWNNLMTDPRFLKAAALILADRGAGTSLSSEGSVSTVETQAAALESAADHFAEAHSRLGGELYPEDLRRRAEELRAEARPEQEAL